MDDFALFHHDKRALWHMQQAVVTYLERLGLQLHIGKSRIYATARGVPFLGMVVFPEYRRLSRRSLLRCCRRFRRLQAVDRDGRMEWRHLSQSVQAMYGHLCQAGTWQWRREVLARIVFQRRGD